MKKISLSIKDKDVGEVIVLSGYYYDHTYLDIVVHFLHEEHIDNLIKCCLELMNEYKVDDCELEFSNTDFNKSLELILSSISKHKNIIVEKNSINSIVIEKKKR